MQGSWVTWEWSAGEVCVCESEHMFGYDVTLYRTSEGRPYPLAILTRTVPMDGVEQKWAREWAIATEDGNYGRATNLMMALWEEGAPIG